MEIELVPFSFDDVDVEIKPLGPEAKKYFAERYGIGCCGIRVRKSLLADYLEMLEGLGFICWR